MRLTWQMHRLKFKIRNLLKRYVSHQSIWVRANIAATLFTAQRPNLGSVILGLENGCASNQHIGAVLDRHLRGLWINTAIDFQVQVWVVLYFPITRPTKLFHLVGAKRLSAETGMDRHDQQQVELVKKLFDQRKRRRWVESQACLATSVSNPLQGCADIVFCFRFNMHRNRVGSCIDETR